MRPRQPLRKQRTNTTPSGFKTDYIDTFGIETRSLPIAVESLQFCECLDATRIYFPGDFRIDLNLSYFSPSSFFISHQLTGSVAKYAIFFASSTGISAIMALSLVPSSTQLFNLLARSLFWFRSSLGFLIDPIVRSNTFPP